MFQQDNGPKQASGVIKASGQSKNVILSNETLIDSKWSSHQLECIFFSGEAESFYASLT